MNQLNSIKTGILLWLVVYNNACGWLSKEPPVRVAKIVVSYPVLDRAGGMTIMPDTIYTYACKDLIVYRFSYQKLNFRNTEFLSEERKYRYFLFRSGDKYGAVCDSFRGAIVQDFRSTTDSILYLHGYQAAIHSVMDSLQLVKSAKSGNKLVQLYTFRQDAKEKIFDSIYLHFDRKLTGVRPSLDPKLDSSRSGKLYKMAIVWNKGFSEQYNMMLPKRVMEFEIMPVKKIEKEVEGFVVRLEREYGRKPL